MLRDSRSYEVQIIDAVRSVNKALGGTYGTSSAIYKSDFNQYEVQLIDAIKGIGKTLSGNGLSLAGGVGDLASSEQFNALARRVQTLENESFFRLVSGNVTLKESYQNLWVPGALAAGGVGTGGGGGGASNLRELEDVAHSSTSVLRADGTTPAADGDALVYDSTLDQWVAAPVSGGSTFNGGEITNDLWLHTNGANYGSRLIFGDRTGGTDWVYIQEDNAGAPDPYGYGDHLTIHAEKGITLSVGSGASVVISDLSVALGGLSDVSISSPSNGDVLKYGNGVWYNGTGGGGSGSTVSVTQIISSGTKIATITVDGVGTDLYAPSGGGGGGSTVSWGTPNTYYTPLTVDGVSKNVLIGTNYVNQDGTQTISGEKTFTTHPVTIASTSGISVNASSYIDIGPVRMKFENNAVHITKASSGDTNNYGLYADGFIAAGGVGTMSPYVRYVQCTQSEYNSLTPDATTIYIIGNPITAVYLGTIQLY